MGEARNKARGIASPAATSALLEQARDTHRRRNFAATRDLCERVLEREPDNAEAMHLGGLARLESGEREQGVAALRRSVALAGDNLGYRRNLALALRIAGDQRGAAQAFSELATRLLAHAATQLEHAASVEALGEVDAAEASYRRAIAADPRLVAAHCGLARVLYERGAVDEAIAAQRWAVTLDPRAMNDGAIGYAHATAGEASQAAEAHAIAACTGHAAPGENVATLVRERELRVIDDFEADFDGWRRFALSRRFDHDGSANDVNFPGIETRGGYATPEQMQRIADALGRDIKWRWPGHGAFRLSFAGSMARSDIHVDEFACRPMYAGVLYLSRPEHCRGGTSFWRHNATGWARIPDDVALRGSPYSTFLDFQQREVLHDGERTGFDTLTRQRDAWTRVLEVPMKANRLIVYRSDFFHAISEVFGTTRDDGRLVQLFFLAPR